MKLRALPISLVAFLIFGATARADAFKVPPVHEGVAVSVQAYGRQNLNCLSWTNGCVLCAKDAVGQTQCSLPGIACQPHGLTCKVLRPK